MEALSENLKYLRRKHSLTQQQVAWAIGVDDTLISHWEAGRRYPTVRGLKELAILFGIDMQSLMDTPLDQRSNNNEEDA